MSKRRKAESKQASGNLAKAETPLQGTNTLPKEKSLAKLSPNTWLKFPSLFLPLESLFSFLCLMGCLHVKGEPQASRLAGSYFSKPHTHTPALWSPDSHIPKRRWCSAKRGT